jgi:hypothetical protein
MSTLETILITATALAITLAPRALDAWLTLRTEALASPEEAQLEGVAGGAE